MARNSRQQNRRERQQRPQGVVASRQSRRRNNGAHSSTGNERQNNSAIGQSLRSGSSRRAHSARSDSSLEARSTRSERLGRERSGRQTNINLTRHRLPKASFSPRGNDLSPVIAIVGVLLVIILLINLVGCVIKNVFPERKNAISDETLATSGLLDVSNISSANVGIYQVDMFIPAALAPKRSSVATITGTSNDGGVAVTELTEATEALEAEGFEVGFALVDINTGITVSYNADSSFYSASSLKGPYVIGLVEYELGDNYASEGTRITNIIKWSDNDSYGALRYNYGNGSFQQLVSAAGISAVGATAADSVQEALAQNMSAESITDNNYEFITPNQMLGLWKQCYEYLISGSAGAEWLGEIFEEPENSAIRSTASGLGTTWSKAGWFPDDDGTGVWSTTVDAGVVRASTGDIVLCVMTTAPEDFATVESIVSPLLALHAALIS